MKKDYLKPRLEVVEVQLSDCIAGSAIEVEGGKIKHVESTPLPDGTSIGWDKDGI